MLGPYGRVTQGPSYAALTLTFDFDFEKFGQGQSFDENRSFFPPSRVVYKVKGLGSLIQICNFLAVRRRWTSQ